MHIMTQGSMIRGQVCESFGRPGKERSDLICQVAASIVRRTNGSSLARKGVCKECFFQMISSVHPSRDICAGCPSSNLQ